MSKVKISQDGQHSGINGITLYLIQKQFGCILDQTHEYNGFQPHFQGLFAVS